MKKINSFEELRAAVEGAEYKADKPFKVLVAIVLIVMVQLRKSYSPEVEERYAACMKAGDVFPAIRGVFDLTLSKIFGYDGEHRLRACKRNGETYILMELFPGTKRDATLLAAGVNDAHGLGRSDEDKRNVVMALLADAEWRGWSSSRIARISRTSVPFVEGLRQEREEAAGNKADPATPVKRKVERNGKVYEMTIPVKPKKDPRDAALAKIVKLLNTFDAEDRQRLVDALVSELKGEDTAA